MTGGRYLVFAGDTYYPRGGWNDLKGSYDELTEAEERAINCVKGGCDWGHIVDTQCGSIVKDY
jgi:hypothetical protein